MIEVKIFKADLDMKLGKNATFTKGELYFFRNSKNNNSLVALSNEGYWITILKYNHNGWGYWNYNPHGFSKKATVYMRNRKRINDIVRLYDAEEYVSSNEVEKYWYATVFKDKKLYSGQKGW